MHRPHPLHACALSAALALGVSAEAHGQDAQPPAQTPQPSTFSLDANASLPFLDLDTLDFAFSGDLSAGYSADRFGINASGSVGAYDLSSDVLLSDALRTAGDFSAWARFPVSHVWSLTTEVQGGAALYDATVVPTTANTPLIFREETSVLYRGAVSASATYTGARLQARVGLGLGGQAEDYSGIVVTDSNAAPIQDTSASSTGLTYSGRVALRWLALDPHLALRLRADASRYALTRASVSVLLDTDALETTAQVEAHAKLFVDVEAWRFAGFVPSLCAGVDVIQRSERQDTLTSTVPLVGVAITTGAL